MHGSTFWARGGSGCVQCRPMSKQERQLRSDLVDLVKGRPGWRLEPRTTPGASPVWCFVAKGEIEFSVSVDDGALHLYVMATDQEFVLQSADDLSTWLEATSARRLSVRRQVDRGGQSPDEGIPRMGLTWRRPTDDPALN